MDTVIIHVPQGSIIKLLPGERISLEKILYYHGINNDCIDVSQEIVTFPQGYVGYISLPTRKIIIEPKHPGIGLKHIMRIYFFLYSTGIEDLDEPIYDIDAGASIDLLENYITALDRVIKKGLPVEYREHSECLRQLRGNVDAVSTMLNKNLGKRELFDCTYDELSNDIPLNQVLYIAYKKAVESIDSEAARLIQRNFANISKVEKIPDVVLTTNTMYCRKALTMAYMILNDLSISDYGNNAYGQNLLINFDKVFEDFIKLVLTKYSGDHNFTYWDEERQYAFCTSTDGNYTKSYIPDMLYKFNGNSIPITAMCVLDMKNKTSKPFSNADVYQMFFYANQLHSKNVILCYPASNDKTNASLKFDNDLFMLKRLHAVYINIAGDSAADFKKHIYDFIENVKRLM